MSTDTPEMTAEECLNRMDALGVTRVNPEEIAPAMRRTVEQADQVNPCTMKGETPAQSGVFQTLATDIFERCGQESMKNEGPEQSPLAGLNREPDPRDFELNAPTGPRPG